MEWFFSSFSLSLSPYLCVCVCVFVCFVMFVITLLRTMLSAMPRCRCPTADIFGFTSTLKTNLDAALGFYNVEMPCCWEQKVKCIKRSLLGNLGLGHMLIPCETRRALFVMLPFSNWGQKREKVSGFGIYLLVILWEGNDTNLRQGKKHTFLPRLSWASWLFQRFLNLAAFL